MAFPFRRRSSQTAKKVTGSKWTGRCKKLREHTPATLSRWRLLLRERNRNLRCRPICERHLRPRHRREPCGRTSRPWRAEIGFTGSPPPSGQRHARVGSTTPARCSLPGSAAFAVSISLDSIAKASALLKWRLKMRAYSEVNGTHNFLPEPTAAVLSVYGGRGGFAAPRIRRYSVSCACGSAERSADTGSSNCDKQL